MRSLPSLLACTALTAVLACGDGGVDPGSDGNGAEIAARFQQLADSVDGEGYSPTADALRHAAEIVRLVGHATPVTLTVDGQDRPFLAVAEQLDFPNIQCTWPDTVVVPPDTVVVPPDTVISPPDTVVTPPDTVVTPPDTVIAPPDTVGPPPDSVDVPGDTLYVPGDSGIVGPAPEPGGSGGGPGECEEVGVYSMRTFIAWEPDNMAEVVRIVADIGSSEVETGVPDVMTGLPAGEAPADGETPPEPGDSAGGGGGGGSYPGFIGEYLVRDVGSWWAVEGTQSNALLESGGACTDDRVTFDWAEFACEAARFRFEFRMRVEAARYDPATGWDNDPAAGGPEGTHEITLSSHQVAGVRLEVVAWTPPVLPPEGPLPPEPPVDSTGVRPDGTSPGELRSERPI